MSYFAEVALGSSFQPFTTLSEQFGFVPKLFRAQTLLPRVIEAEGELISAILFTDKALTRAQKECILLALAASQGNAYCFSLHYQMLKLLGVAEARLDRIISDFRQADLSPTTTALLTLVSKLGTKDGVREATSQGLSDESIFETILTASLSRLLCTLSTGVGAIPDFASRPIPPMQVTAVGADDSSQFFLPAPNLPDDFAPIAFLRDQFGTIPKVFRAQTLRPDVLGAEHHAIRTVLVPEVNLTRGQKEAILLAREPTDKALQTFARTLTSETDRFSVSEIQALRGQGFTEEQILEAVVTTSLACFFDVLQAGLGAGRDFAATMGAKKAHLSASDQRHTDVILPVDPDGECVARVQGGDLDAFEELMNRHSQRVYRTLVGILGNPDDARDAMQDTFLKAFQHLARFEGRSKFSTWLVSIATNTGIQRLRERRPMESLDETGFDEEGFRPRQVQAWMDDPEQLYSQAEMRSLVESGVMKLPAKYRVVVMLRDIEQLSVEETAAALGLGIPAFKARLLRGRLMLRETLASQFISSGRKGSMKGAII